MLAPMVYGQQDSVVTTTATKAVTPVKRKFDRGIEKQTFVPKGQWIVGLNASYMEANSKDFQFLVVEDFTANGFTAGAKASVAYVFANDLAVGLSMDYSRTMVRIDDVTLKLSEDMTFGVHDYYTVQHVFTATAFLRTYINIGKSKRFGLYNDLRFNFGGGQGKILNGKGEAMVGTYEKIQKASLTLAPGISVFATDFMAIEASVGILGIKYSRTEQITNQVYQGSWETLSADFKINLLSVALGITFYF